MILLLRNFWFSFIYNCTLTRCYVNCLEFYLLDWCSKILMLPISVMDTLESISDYKREGSIGISSSSWAILKLNINSEPTSGSDLNFIFPSNCFTIILLITRPNPMPSVLYLFMTLEWDLNKRNNLGWFSFWIPMPESLTNTWTKPFF